MVHNPWRVQAWDMYYRTLYPTNKPADLEDYLNWLKENLAPRGRFEGVVSLGYSSRQPSEERLKRVEAPTLVIMGAKDPDFADPQAEGRYIAEHTGGSLELVQGAGHYPQTEMPAETAAFVIDFLKQSVL